MQEGLNDICRRKHGNSFAYARQSPREVFVCHIADATFPNGNFRTDFLLDLHNKGLDALSQYVVPESDLQRYMQSEQHCSILGHNEFFYSRTA